MSGICPLQDHALLVDSVRECPWSTRHKVPHAGWLKQTLVLSSFWRLEAQVQGIGTISV